MLTEQKQATEAKLIIWQGMATVAEICRSLRVWVTTLRVTLILDVDQFRARPHYPFKTLLHW